MKKGLGIGLHFPQMILGGASGGGAFSGPADISNLWAWYKADVGVKEADDSVVEDLDDVKTWEDQSGNGRHLTQATAAARPRWAANIRASKGGITAFSGDWLANTFGATMGANSTWFVVLRMPASTGTNTVAFDGLGVSPVAIYKNSSERIVTTAGTQLVSTATVSANGFYIITLVANGGNGIQRYNGGAGFVEKTGAIGSNTPTGLTACNDSSHALHFTGYLHEIIVYNKALNSTEYGNVEAYLATRWGF
jgi:hypothetical protein